MPGSPIADSSALVALFSRDDKHHDWIAAQAGALPWPWISCEAALTEFFHLPGHNGGPRLTELLRRQVVVLATAFGDQLGRILDLMDKYADVPMSFTDACLVLMSELLPNPVVITTDPDF